MTITLQLEPELTLSPENPSQYSIIYKWRLEQERYMKAHNGGAGMRDDEVKASVPTAPRLSSEYLPSVRFVDRYIPGYVFFGDVSTQDTVRHGANLKWAGKGLNILLDNTREMVDYATF